MEALDCIVVGAGFGGLGTALGLAEAGARVALCEALRYPGGCASTFSREGLQFESGATLFAGFGEGQLFARWVRRHGLRVRSQALDPVVELRAPGLALAVPAARERLVERLCALPGAPVPALRRFWRLQARIADALWALLDAPEVLPPFGRGAPGALAHLARRLWPAALPFAREAGLPLARVMEREGVLGFEPLRVLADAVCQITVQTSAARAEAPVALAALDYFFRGAHHVHGGIGTFAWELVRALERLGADVRLAQRVQRLERTERGGWRAVLQRGHSLEARCVVANLLPQGLAALLPAEARRPAALGRWGAQVEAGWGAVMLYLVLPADAPLPPGAHHLELVDAPGEAFQEGNHVFCSVSGRDEARGPRGERTVTVSTHVPLAALGREPAPRVDAVKARMRRTLERRAPALAASVVRELGASPRTFERFTGRHRGLVGGVPRTAGLVRNYLVRPAPRVRPGLFLVGDSFFPGQSILAAATGGLKAAERVLRALGETLTPR